MIRTGRTLALFVTAFAIATVAGAQDQSHTYSHIRSTDAALIHAVDDAIDRSPTFRSLFDRLSATNLFVYLRREVFDPHRPEDSRAM